MKKLLFIVCLSLGIMPFTFAQNETTNVTDEDYDRLIENTLKMEFRTYVLEKLDLTKEEILKFDPILKEYMAKRSEKIQKKYDLLEEYSEEMAEDDRYSDEKNETIEFVEDYWEVEIDEMQLKKRYFERVAEAIPFSKAVEFFLIEEMTEHRVKQHVIGRTFPVIVEFELSDTNDDTQTKGYDYKSKDDKNKSTYTYKEKSTAHMDKSDKEKSTAHMDKSDKNMEKVQGVSKKYYTSVGEFDNWVTTSGRAVDISHEYTHNGLTKLANAVYSLSEAYGIESPSLKNHKKAVIKIADELRKDPLSTDHADITREAFMTVAKMMDAMTSDSKCTATVDNLNELEAVAKKMNPDKLMTNQAPVIYDYFEKAQEIVNDISSQIKWADSQNKYNK